MSVIRVGVGKFLIASRYLGRGSTVVSLTQNQAKSTDLEQNWNLSGFKMIPCFPTRIR